MDAKIFRINYKSDFILTLNSDAGWMTPFCIKFWTGAPSQAYFVGWDGETYTHCAYDPTEPTKLLVQFDDHHLPIGDLKFQIAYHFTVADFPDDTEDEVINPASITVVIDGEQYQVMLDFTGETAPEIEFSLPAYANEAQRIANEQQRIAAEDQRIANEQARINAETTRQQNEEQRINQEQARVNEYSSLKADAVAATGAANDAAALANQKAQLAADKAALAQSAADLANAKAQLATDKAALAASAAQLANDKAALAQQKAEYAQTQGGYAKDQGDYAKDQGDYAKAQGDYAKDQGDYAKEKGDYAKDQGDYAKEQGNYAKAKGDICAADHQTAVADHQTATADHQTAAADHQTATADHNQAGNDHTRAESDHTRAESDHDAVELYVDSLGVFDLSKHNAVGGVLATYANLDAALTALNALESKYKYGGMSFKFVHSSDNNYVQYLYKVTDAATAETFTNVDNWEKMNLEEEIYSLAPSRSYSITQGVALNTSSVTKQLPVSLSSGEEVEVLVQYPASTVGNDVSIYLMNGSTIVSTVSWKNDIKITIPISSSVTGIGINIKAAKAVATGTVNVICYITKGLIERVGDLEERVDALKTEMPIKVNGRLSTNLFNKDAVTSGYYVSPSSGTLIENSSFSASDFIPVIEGGKISATAISNCAYYDKNKNYLQSAGAANPNTVPSGAAFIRVSVGNSSLSTYQLNNSTELLPYEPYGSFLTPSSFDETTLNYLEDTFGIEGLKKVREHLENPFIKTQIKLVGDSITAGQGGTGYSATGENIGGSSGKANVLTAICWSNMLYHYIDMTYNRDFIVSVRNNNVTKPSLSISSSISQVTQIVDGVLIHADCLVENNTTVGREFISFHFFGNHFSFYHISEASRGIFEIYVDGTLVKTVDCYAETGSRLREDSVSSLTNGEHSVSFKCTNSKNANSSGKQIGITGLVIPKSAIVKPWGVGGTTSVAAYNTEGMYSQDDDFVILEYGTNDRHIFLTPDNTTENLIKAGELIRDTYGAMPIFMCAPPCSENYEDGNADSVHRYFHMWNVHDAVDKVCKYFHIPMIDNYTAFQEYADEHNINTDTLLADGLHPNDLGYKVIYDNIMKELGLARQPYYYEWDGGN